jgi:hypothetical protein
LSLANGNLQFIAPGGGVYYNGRGTMVPLEKTYIEVKLDGSSIYCAFGFQDISQPVLGNNYLGVTGSNSISFGDLGFSDWVIYNNGSLTQTGITLTSAATLMFAYDPATRKVWFGVNGTWYNSGNPAAGTNQFATLSTSITYTFAATNRASAGGYVNFGQRAYTYTAPSGFKALCTQNLPEPTVVQGDDYFNTVIYTGTLTDAQGTGATQSITGVGFQPDFLWLKNRTYANQHLLVDAVRTVASYNFLTSASTGAEVTVNTNGAISSLDADGFTLENGNDSGAKANNVARDTWNYVAWNWKANGAGVSNTDGTIPGTVTVSANTTAGISIVTYTGNATSGATVGHGLGVAPSMIILKIRSTTGNWPVYHVSNGNTKAQYLDLTLGTGGDFTGAWNNTTPTSTVFTLGNSTETNASAGTFVAYCFAEVEGFSKFGSYTGNGSADGTFVYTGFRPAFLIIKRTTGDSWFLSDSARSPVNFVDDFFKANAADPEGNMNITTGIDYLSNGFKARSTDSAINASGGTYIFMAFAENPFKYSLAR